MKNLFSKKKIFVMAMLCVVALALVGCGGGGEKDPASTDTAAVTTFKLVLGEAQGSPQDEYAKIFKKELEAASGGKYTVQIFPVGQLGNGADQGELIQNGAVEMGFLPAGDAGSIVPASNIFSLHYIFPSDLAQAKKFIRESDVIWTDLNGKYAEKNMQVIDWLDEGFMEWTSNKAINSPADMKGLKMRVMASPIITAAFEAYGCNPVNIAYSELYSGLQLKMADGQTNPVEEIEHMKFYEVQSDLTMANSDIFLASLIVNKPLWDGMSDEVKGYFTTAVEKTVPQYDEVQKKLSTEAIGKLETAGMKINYLNDDAVNQFRELSKKAYGEFVKIGGDDAQALLDNFVKEAASYY